MGNSLLKRWLSSWSSFSCAQGVPACTPRSSRINRERAPHLVEKAVVGQLALGVESGTQVVQQVGGGDEK